MDDTLHWLGLMRFRWLLLGAVAVGCSLNPQPDLPAPRGEAENPAPTTTGGSGGSVNGGSGATSSGGGSVNVGDLPDSGVGGDDSEPAEGQGGVPSSAGAGTVVEKEAGAAGAEDVH